MQRSPRRDVLLERQRDGEESAQHAHGNVGAAEEVVTACGRSQRRVSTRALLDVPPSHDIVVTTMAFSPMSAMGKRLTMVKRSTSPRLSLRPPVRHACRRAVAHGRTLCP
jgi:hypothetical protein